MEHLVTKTNKRQSISRTIQILICHFVCFVLLILVLGALPDKIFVASDNKVKAFNRKGKIFLTFTSNLTEPIKTMFVTGNDMILCGNHVYNHYRDCKDIGSYLCGDTIVDVIALCPSNVSCFELHIVRTTVKYKCFIHCRPAALSPCWHALAEFCESLNIAVSGNPSNWRVFRLFCTYQGAIRTVLSVA